MLKTLIVLPDGTELYSGVGAANAIQSVTITECVNNSQDLMLGSTCANMVEAKLITPEGGLNITAGDEITVYKVDDKGARHKVGLFTTEKPTRPSAHSMSITAYDRVCWLDKDLSLWLFGLQGWPYTLFDLANMVCSECGLDLVNEEIPNGDYMVQAFSGEGITGRQIMQWIGQAAGRFCRATPDGQIEFAWYKPVEVSIGTTNITDVSTAIYYYQNSLSFEDYQVAPVEKVQIRLTEEDVGSVYPDTVEETNTYIISGNYLLTTSDAEALEPMAQVLYEQLKDVSYTPCKVSVPTNLDIRAGSIVSITDRNGKTITAYVMTRTSSGQRDTLECTGTQRRDSSTAVNNQSYKALSGKVLNLRTDVEGLKVENKDAREKIASLELTVDGINAKVSGQETDVAGVKQQITALEQTSRDIKFSVQSIQENGVNRVSNEFGLTIDQSAVTIHRNGSQMINKLNEKGMYVVRGEGTSNEAVMLQADADGVIATDVSVRNYLVIGSHARIEDYNNGADKKRTACFWLGG